MGIPLYDKEYYRKYYNSHKQRKMNTNRDWRKRNVERHHEIARVSSKKQRAKIKSEIITILGGKCSNPNCLVPNGCSDIRCLQIDHINGGGKRERRGHQDRGSHYYRDILKKLEHGSKDYQLLCANCNWIKRFENHETGSRWGRKVV